MPRSASKGEDQSKKQNPDLQKLSERMEEMAAKFTTDLNSFKKQLSRKPVENTISNSIGEISDLTKLSEKFDSFEKSVLSSLEAIKQEFNQLKSFTSKQIMASNQNVILVHGIEERQPKDLLDDIIKFVTTKFGLKISKSELNYCHRLGIKKPSAKKPRPVVVCFCQRWLRDEIFYKKKQLKGTNFLVTELLTSENLTLYKEVRTHFHNACYTAGGKVYVVSDGVRSVVSSQDQLLKMIGKKSVSDSDSEVEVVK